MCTVICLCVQEAVFVFRKLSLRTRGGLCIQEVVFVYKVVFVYQCLAGDRRLFIDGVGLKNK